MARVWHLYDAKWQDPYTSAPLIIRYLKGLYKPIYHPMSEYLIFFNWIFDK